jgi:signal transduction histidine kinase
MLETTLNTCRELGMEYHTIAYYSHLLPLAISLYLGFYVFFKKKYSLLSCVYLTFVLSFALWLLGDLITWTSSNYHLISFSWSLLDLVNISFFLLAVYFFDTLVTGKDMHILKKVFLIALSIPALFITATGNSIGDFYLPVCEALENGTLTFYKIVVEAICLIFITNTAFVHFKKSDGIHRKQIFVIGTSLLLFLLTFSATEYISSYTDIYQINLYSLFILPLFLFAIIFSITSLKVFELKVFGTQILLYSLNMIIVSQFFFLQDSANKLLNIVALAVSVGLSYLLIRSVKKEIQAREQVQQLVGELQSANARLQELDLQKTEFVSFATHQLRSPLTAIKGYASLILGGDFGAISDEVKEAIERVYESSGTLSSVVDDYLNISRIELGSMKYDFKPLDLRKLTEEVIEELKPNTGKTGLSFSFEAAQGSYMVSADQDKFKQVIANLIDNSVKYTPHGSVHVALRKKDGKVVFSIIDTGIGISAKTIPKLFLKFSRADKANETNIKGTGLGLYVAKEIVKAHKGKIWAESEGEGKGSQFYIEIDEIEKGGNN